MGEKTFYKSLNRSSSIRFPIQVNIALSSHKVTLIIQANLGGADLTSAADGQSQLTQFKTDLALVFKHIHRLIRCVADCQIKRGDSISTSHALMLGRSLGAGVWDDSPLIMKQIEGIGLMGVRRLVAANIRSIEELEFLEGQVGPQQLDCLHRWAITIPLYPLALTHCHLHLHRSLFRFFLFPTCRLVVPPSGDLLVPPLLAPPAPCRPLAPQTTLTTTQMADTVRTL